MYQAVVVSIFIQRRMIGLGIQERDSVDRTQQSTYSFYGCQFVNSTNLYIYIYFRQTDRIRRQFYLPIHKSPIPINSFKHMGNSSSTLQQSYPVLQPYHPSTWIPEGQSNQAKLVRHSQTGLPAELYHITPSTHISLDNNTKLYEFRRANPDHIVQVYQVDKEQLQGESNFCRSGDTFQVITERIPVRLADFQNIPFKQGLQLFGESLKGFQILHNLFGPFEITDSMIGINSQDKVKVWHHPDFSENLPFRPISTISSYHSDEAAMISHIFDAVFTKVQKNNMPQAFINSFNKKSPATFEAARTFLDQHSITQKQVVVGSIHSQKVATATQTLSSRSLEIRPSLVRSVAPAQTLLSNRTLPQPQMVSRLPPNKHSHKQLINQTISYPARTDAFKPMTTATPRVHFVNQVTPHSHRVPMNQQPNSSTFLHQGSYVKPPTAQLSIFRSSSKSLYEYKQKNIFLANCINELRRTSQSQISDPNISLPKGLGYEQALKLQILENQVAKLVEDCERIRSLSLHDPQLRFLDVQSKSVWTKPKSTLIEVINKVSLHTRASTVGSLDNKIASRISQNENSSKQTTSHDAAVAITENQASFSVDHLKSPSHYEINKDLMSSESEQTIVFGSSYSKILLESPAQSLRNNSSSVPVEASYEYTAHKQSKITDYKHSFEYTANSLDYGSRQNSESHS